MSSAARSRRWRATAHLTQPSRSRRCLPRSSPSILRSRPRRSARLRGPFPAKIFWTLFFANSASASDRATPPAMLRLTRQETKMSSGVESTMLIKKFLLTLCLATACAMPVAASAQPFHHGPGGGFGGGMTMPMMMLLRHVDLTADQQTQIHQIMDANFAEARPLMKQLHGIHDSIADKLMTPGTV